MQLQTLVSVIPLKVSQKCHDSDYNCNDKASERARQ